ncbi:MAG: isochorismatase family protein, partial [Hyphomicrobiaceae bacterium]
MLAERSRAHLMIIDVQERLAPHIAGGEAAAANCVRLVRYARRLGVPVTLTEQYPKGLGATVESLREAAGNEVPCLEKISFSCWRDHAIRARIEALEGEGRDQIVVAGMETHVCVGQTVLDLRAAGKTVLVVAVAVGSRVAAVRDLAIVRFRAAGASIVAQEMI